MPDDGWAAFTADPAPASSSATSAPAPSAPASDGWEAFTAPAAPASAAPTAPKYDEYDAQGRWIGYSDEGFQTSNARPHVEPAPPPDARKTGYLANTAAGVVEGAAGGLNVLSDPIGNLVGKPLVTAGMFAHDALAPVFGYERFTPEFRSTMLDDTVPQPGTRIADAAGRAMGAPATADVVPATTGEGIVRRVVPAAVGMAALGGGSGVVRNAVINPALGVSGDLGGEAASAVAPEWAKPFASLVGNVAGISAPNGLASLGGRVLPTKPNGLLDDAGAPVISRATGAPLSATPGQVRVAGEQLTAAATDPAAVRAALDNPPAQVMPGDQPTTAKLTGDPGLNAAEFTASRTGTDKQKAAFTAQANRQNDLRVAAIKGQAADGDVATADAALKAHAEAADAAQAARVSGVQSGSAADVAAAEASGQGRVGGLTDAADTARASIGGDLPAGSDAAVGAALRRPIAEANQAAKAREGALWDAIDPDGKLAVDMRPIKSGAADILGEMSPNAAPLAGNEAGIFSTAAALPSVQSFRDLTALRSRLTDAIRQERSSPTGDAQAVRRMSMLLGRVHDAMEKGVVDQTAATLLHNQIETWQDEQNAASSQTSSDRGRNTGRDASGGPGAVPAVAGAEVPRGGQRESGGARSADPTGRLSPGATDEIGSPLAGPNRQAETLHDFVISRGGVKDQSGEYAAQDLDRIHHRAGGRLVNNTGGISEDYMREAAVQEGFLPANADINDFRDAMLSDVPVHRISEAHDAAARAAERTQTYQTAEARYNSRDAIAVAADNLGVRLSPDEIAHATELHMRGDHAEEAIRQAAAATESRVLDRNAAANAVGSPGVPLAAQQTDNGLTGATRLQPNFDAAAQARYAAARQATSDRAATFKSPPGVGEVLQGGPQAGTFRSPDSAVPNIIVKVGPAGADVAKAYLAAGGSPAALSDAAAYSLRQAAARPDGTLDPAKVGAWAKARASFLSEIPEAANRFSAAADAQRAVEAGTKDAAAALKQATATAQLAVDDAMAARASAAKAVANERGGKVPGSVRSGSDGLVDPERQKEWPSPGAAAGANRRGQSGCHARAAACGRGGDRARSRGQQSGVNLRGRRHPCGEVSKPHQERRSGAA